MEKADLDYFDWLKHNTKWFRYAYFRNIRKLTDEEINYYVADNSNYQNFTQYYYMMGIVNHSSALSAFRYHAYQAYKDITEKLNLNIETTDKFSINLTDEELQKIIGTYKFEEETIIISYRNDKIYYKEFEVEEEIFLINKTFFTIDRESFNYFRTFNVDHNNNVVGLTLRKGNTIKEWKKIN